MPTHTVRFLVNRDDKPGGDPPDFRSYSGVEADRDLAAVDSATQLMQDELPGVTLTILQTEVFEEPPPAIDVDATEPTESTQ